jgi:processive 1,2-diacylglycerol beta-glucosyltransferase
VTPPRRKRILIVTAAFGEGHNSAARNLAGGIEELGEEAVIADPCLLGAPVTTHWLCKGYRLVTTRAPRLWLSIYRSTDRHDFRRERFPLMRKPERRLGELITADRFAAVVCTYPLYPYFLERLFAAGTPRLPVFTVVTDSIEINAAWRRAPTDHWLVTDPFTRDALIHAGLPAAQVAETGFPVNPAFARLAPVSPADPADPFRILYFPTAKRPQVSNIGAALLAATGDRGRLTIVLGHNFRRLYHRACELKESFGERVTIKGWTRRVPELMCRHHLVVGKAGGATVHEALAAQCPMLVHHLVPGQEEGNTMLLQRLGGGWLAESTDRITATIRELLANDAAGWHQAKQNLARLSRSTGATTAARFVLSHCGMPGERTDPANPSAPALI